MSECLPGPVPALCPFLPGLRGPLAGLAAPAVRLPDRAREDGEDEGRREESAWIRAARGGDARSFRHLVDRYRDRAYETALRIVRNPEEAEEATQDAFVRAWRALPGFREDARFSTWLYRIVTRRALDAATAARRRSARETASEPEVLERHAAEEASPLPRPSLRRLDAVLAELPPTPRAVITLFYLRERSIREIGEMLELPEGTVKTHLHRSRATLRRAWSRREAREGRSHGLPRL